MNFLRNAQFYLVLLIFIGEAARAGNCTSTGAASDGRYYCAGFKDPGDPNVDCSGQGCMDACCNNQGNLENCPSPAIIWSYNLAGFKADCLKAAQSQASSGQKHPAPPSSKDVK